MTPEIERLVEELTSQARSEARRFYQSAPQQLDLDELTSWALLGLAKAGDRWAGYCEKNSYSPGATQYFAAYALRYIRGAMYDSMRSADWVTRSVRRRAKDLREAGQDLGADENDLTQRTGLTRQQIRDTVAAVARRPVSMDAEPVDVADSDDVEGQAIVNAASAAAITAILAQPAPVQIVLALRYHQGLDLRAIAAQLEQTEADVGDLHTAGILAVHQAMLAVVAESPGRPPEKGP